MQYRWQSFVEFLLVSIAVFYVYRVFRGTRGASVLTGFVTLLISLAVVSSLLQLEAISLLLQMFSTVLVISLIVIFQPELRQVLADLGRRHFFDQNARQTQVIESVVQSLEYLKEHHYGALIAFMKSQGKSSVSNTGVSVDGVVSEEMLSTIFTNKTPLHDGGVVIVGDRLESAGCIFPVSQRQNLSRILGLRHRAALGISEESEAVVVVLSEETGDISICQKGEIFRPLTSDQLRLQLSETLLADQKPKESKLGTFQTILMRLRGDGYFKTGAMISYIEMLGCALVAFVIWTLLIRGVRGDTVFFFWRQ